MSTLTELGVGRPRRPVASVAAQTITTQSAKNVEHRGGASALLSRYRKIIVASDFVAATVACLVALTVRFGGDARPMYLVLSVIGPLLWVGAVAAQRGYERRFLGTGPGEYRRLADATLVVFALTAGVSFTVNSDLSRGYVMISLPMALALSFVGRRQLRSWLFRQRLAGQGMQRVLVVGRSDAVAHVVEQLEREPWHGLAAVEVCATPETVDLPAVGGSEDAPTDPDLAGPSPTAACDPEQIMRTVSELDIDVVAVASHPDLSGHALRRLAWLLEERGVELIVSPGIVEVAGPRLSIRPVAGLSLLHLERPATKGGRVLAKNLLDRLLALGLLVVAAPLLLLVAVAVKMSSPGPVLYRQTRIGVRGRPFQMLKFRSMVADAEARRRELEAMNEDDGLKFKIRNDPRVTRVGAWLRRFSVDELPQLWNVVRGEMSLVGPRPPLPAEVAAYDSDATRRLRVRPGLTGLWQVQRPQRPVLGGVVAPRPAVRRQLVVHHGPVDPVAHLARGAQPQRRLLTDPDRHRRLPGSADGFLDRLVDDASAAQSLVERVLPGAHGRQRDSFPAGVTEH